MPPVLRRLAPLRVGVALLSISSLGVACLGLAQRASAEPPLTAPVSSPRPAAAPAAEPIPQPAPLPPAARQPDIPPAAAEPLRAQPRPSAASPADVSPPAARPAPAPLRLEPGTLAAPEPRRFDRSLDELVRDGVVTQSERNRIRTGAMTSPVTAPAHRQACRSGALSEQECSTGVVVRWRGRNENQAWPLDPSDPAAREAAQQGLAAGSSGWSGVMGDPLSTTPLTVPVSSLLIGDGSSLRLAEVFAVTPRPAPVAGNGNRSLLLPVIGSALNTSGFGFRLHPILGSWLMHAGIDLAAPTGTPVVAALTGRVVSSGNAGGYGLAIELEHDNPRRRTLYAHLSELYVKPGDRVRQGEVIGRVGSTGLSTGPHLHFELRLPGDGGWVAVDPGPFDQGSNPLNPLGSDVIAQLMGQLLQRLERPGLPGGEASSVGG
ncbi:M23 family metallopeptidase [Cyanobium sp. CH-040]|uniref:M23 family metallopeptidase n=1 Tax=Cyanobium sp. CH-040 TaxID=2823708 RepID=UPI0037BF5BC6